MKDLYLVIDFDSTLVTCEGLDELANIALAHRDDREAILAQIKGITQMGMEGKISFSESLKRRLALFEPNKQDVARVAKLLTKKISPSVKKNTEFFQKNASRIYIISGGFSDYILPVVKSLGIRESHVLANAFVYSEDGRVVGIDKRRVLSKSQGKARALSALRLSGSVFVLGDGYTDYEIKKSGVATAFWAYTENVRRASVVALSDRVVKSFDEVVLELSKSPVLSYPKEKMRVLLLENIHPVAAKTFSDQGYRVEQAHVALSEEELASRLAKVSILGIRSKTQVTREVLEASPRLLAVGAFSIGVNQIDLESCALHGVAVFNAPYSNTRSVVELVVGEIVMLARGIFDKSSQLHRGVWDKSANGAHEIRGKTLGIIGYGNIGSQLSVVCESLGMKVIFYDVAEKLVLGNATRAKSLEELLSASDFVTVHVDGRASNEHLIGKREFLKMKHGSFFINNSRGSVVDVDALSDVLSDGRLSGAAVDVFPYEPYSNHERFVSPLQNLPNVILTPHIGGSTEEAQSAIGEFVSNRITQFVDLGDTSLSVNFPQLSLPPFDARHRIIHIHRNEVGVLASLNRAFSTHGMNILSQYLSTNSDIGYVITDVDTKYSARALDAIRSVRGTIRMRVLY